MDGHRVRGEDIKKIRPWGRSLTPAVTVEFAHGRNEYRINKRFLDNPLSKLERKENGRFVPLAESDKADEMVRSMINGNLPGRGVSRSEHWGLAQVLWAPQGELALEGLSGDLMNQIRASLGAQVAGPAGDPVEKRIEEAYLKIYTPKGGYKTGKDGAVIVQFREKLQLAIAERTGAKAQQQEYEEAVRKVEDLRANQIYARNTAEALGKQLKETRSRAESYQKLVTERKGRAESVRAEEERYKGLKERIESIATARKELHKAAESLVRIEDELPLQERELLQREKEAVGAKFALGDVRKERSNVDASRMLAEQSKQFTDNSGKLADLDGLLNKITTAQENLDNHKKERAELVAPDEKRLRAIREAISKRNEAKLRIGASLITLEIVPEVDGKLIVVSGEELGEVDLGAGIPARFKGSPEVVADLSGVARITASGPVGSIEEHRAELARYESELKRLTEPFGTADIESLESLLDKSRELAKKIDATQTQVDTWLSGRTLEQIQQQRSEIQAVQAGMVRDHPEWQNQTPDPSALKEAADDISNSFKTRIDEAEARRDTAQNALLEASRRKEQLSSQAEGARKMKESLEVRLAGLTGDGIQDEERAEKLKEATLLWDAARLKLEEIDAQLKQFEGNPADTAARLEKQFQAAEEAADKARDDEKTGEGKLYQLSAKGTYSALAEAEERVASLQAEVADEELHAGAIRLLHDTLIELRNETMATVAGPVESVATQIFRRIAGGRLGDLKLGKSFEATDVVPEISGEAVSLEGVSGGEREQIHLATRLALAEVLAKEERQMVVLDDVMTFTDAARMARVMVVLEEEAGRLQIIVLTCHPERYAGLDKANFVDLEDILRRENS